MSLYLLGALTNIALLSAGSVVIYSASKTFFPEQTNDVLYSIGWSSIKGYKRMNKYYKKYVLSFYKRNILHVYYKVTGTDPKINCIVLVKDGKEIKKFKNFDELKKNKELPKCDFILHIHPNDDDDNNNDDDDDDDDETKNYTVRYNEIPEDTDYKKSNCSFVAVELKYEDKTYSIDLKNPHNFLIQENELLDYPFLKWYMKKQYSIDISQNYIIELIDGNINTKKIVNSQSIILKDNRWDFEEYHDDTSDSEDYEKAAASGDYSFSFGIYDYLFPTKEKTNKEK